MYNEKVNGSAFLNLFFGFWLFVVLLGVLAWQILGWGFVAVLALLGAVAGIVVNKEVFRLYRTEYFINEDYLVLISGNANCSVSTKEMYHIEHYATKNDLRKILVDHGLEGKTPVKLHPIFDPKSVLVFDDEQGSRQAVLFCPTNDLFQRCNRAIDQAERERSRARRFGHAQTEAHPSESSETRAG